MNESSQHNGEFPWVVFSLKDTLCAISACDVLSMVGMPSVVQVPHTPDYVRGVINLRGRVMPVVDLRARLGMRSFTADVEDFCAMMEQREQDHKNWLRELEESVREGREFKLAVDPHQCVFGQWFDSYKPESHLLGTLVKKFKVPHEKIHAIAATVKSLEKRGDIEAAHKIIEECRDNELAEMIGLFSEMRKAYIECSREICVVLSSNSQQVAVAVDSIKSVERLNNTAFQDIPEMLQEQMGGSRLISSTGRRKKHEDIVLIVDHHMIVEELDVDEYGSHYCES